MALPPLTFDPILKEKVWGGRRLERLGKALPPGVAVGESWELADLAATDPGGGGGGEARSRIASGPYAGRTLAELIAESPAPILGRASLTPAGGFPLLLKFLDAAANLSVQVHPSAAYARANPAVAVKHEAWVVLDAAPGAVLYKGLRAGVDAAALRAAAQEGTVADVIQAVEATAGDVHHLPSGTVHALGAGVMVAEVQTPSDTTFRLYDWGRTGRELHIEEALACAASPEPTPPVASTRNAAPGGGSVALVRTAAFTLAARRGPAAIALAERRPAPAVWMILTGSIHLEAEGEGGASQRLAAGDTILLPATMTPAQATLSSDATLLEVNLPVAGA